MADKVLLLGYASGAALLGSDLLSIVGMLAKWDCWFAVTAGIMFIVGAIGFFVFGILGCIRELRD